MLKEIVINTATRLGVEDQLRSVCGPLYASYRRDRIDNQHMRLLFSFVLTANSNCIDIGAHKGAVLTEMVRVAPNGKHIAYEPLPHLNKYLVNHFPAVDVRLAAVSNEEGETSFNYIKNLPTHSGLREKSYPMQPQLEKITVRTETLDRSLPSGYVPSLIKIDVEGAEGLVIEGAIETIAKCKPVIIFEHGNASNHYDTQPRRIYELLHDEAGLRIFDMDGKGPYSLDQFVETQARGDRWNFVARP